MGAESVNVIVVGYDDAEPAKRALERAAQLAGALSARLVVTSVIPVTQPATGRSIGTDPDVGTTHAAQLATARALLAASGVDADYVEAVGHPAEAIVDVATERGADLIVVGTHEPGFVQRLLGSSVSDAVAHKARCDVLIVH
jgi:nucleotide-binding universal stress UspA family protein